MTNQDWGVQAQLDHGARMLQSQIHKKGAALQLCHTNCFIHDGGSVLDYLKNVKTWLDGNPREVLTILFTNSDSIDVESISEPFQQAGILDMAYKPPSAKVEDWPTLSALIDSNQRVVLFMDYHADYAKVPAILDEFANMWEDEYNAVNASWPCEMDRGEDEGTMYLHNHFLDKKDSLLGTEYFTPDMDKLTTTNAASGEGSLGDGINSCIQKHQRAPTFVLVDYESHGNGSAYQAAAEANGLKYVNPGTIHPPTASELSHEMDGGEDTSKAHSNIAAGSLSVLLLTALCITIM